MVQVKLENEVSDGASNTKPNPPSPKSRLAVLKRNKKVSNAQATDPFRFQGNGVTYKGKLIGERDVPAARGDEMCAEAMRSAKAAVKAAGAHKTRVQLQINIEGIKILDEKSNAVLHNFPVSRISFVARDASDARAFGLVFGDSTNNYRFYGIKTAQNADQTVLAIRDMFQVVFEMKKKHIEQVKQQQNQNGEKSESGNGSKEASVAVADLLDLESELHNIEQGVQQLQQIPTMTDPFGATPFGDPFADSFSSNSNTPMNNSASYNSSAFGTTTSPAPALPQQMPIQQQQAWPQIPPTAAIPTIPTQGYVVPQMAHPLSQPSLPTFSETNPFATPQSQLFPPPPADPFVSRLAPPPPTSSIRQDIEWGTNENTAPQLHHANTFASFDSQTKFDNKWEDNSKRVTSLEEAFSKLVDMDSLVGPAEMKKNPFEHIINPPKASLNSMSARPTPVMAAAAQADPFSDDFFR